MSQDRRLGLFSTIPLEVVFAAGLEPVDLNNRFMERPSSCLKRADEAGLPRSLCAWTRGLYGAAHYLGIRRIVSVVTGDCSANRGLSRLLQDEGIEVVEFRYPLGRRGDRAAWFMQDELERFCAGLGTDIGGAERCFDELRPIRRELQRLDELTWREGLVSGGENHRWLISSTDFDGRGPGGFLADLKEFNRQAGSRSPLPGSGLRLGVVGVPPAFTDLHDVLQELGARVVFNEVPRSFAMIPPAASLLEQLLRYSYPYGLESRLPWIRRAIEQRRLDGMVLYEQSFCHHNLEGPALDRGLERLPRIRLECDEPGGIGQRDRLRIEGFLQTCSVGERMRMIKKSDAVMGLDLGSRKAKLALRTGAAEERLATLDSMKFYSSYAGRKGGELTLDLAGILENEFGVNSPIGVTAVATGYGRHIAALSGCRVVSEIQAHGAGAAACVEGDFLLADIGGQDTKCLAIEGGAVADFVMNDRCAAGSGRYVENMARLLDMELAELVRHHRDPVPLSNLCATFGESEIIGHVVSGVTLERIAAGILKSVADRLLQLLARLQRSPEDPLWLAGGLAASRGLVGLLQAERPGPVQALAEPGFNGVRGCLELGTKVSP